VKLRTNSLSDQIRQAIDECGVSRYAISKALGLDQALLSRFMSGKGGLAVKTIDKIGAFLRLQIVVQPQRPKGKGR